ncbi:MAG: hypothetical protein HXX20_04060 [Chloroflexi bacterium]|nr:hypothetical protein [Chloroflexota bacterium]
MFKSSQKWVLAVSSFLLLSLGLVACSENSPPTSVAPTPEASLVVAPTLTPEPLVTSTPVIVASLPPFTPPTKASNTASPTSIPRVTPLPLTTPPSATTPFPPQYSPAPLSAFKLNSAAGFGLNQKTIRRLESFLIPTDTIPPSNQPGLTSSVALMAENWKIALPLWWCESSADMLKTNWAAFSFSLTLDDQPVDLKPYATVDFEANGLSCRAIDLVLGATPPGTHRLSLTRNLSNEIVSGATNRKLAPGNYVYQITLLSFTPNPNPSKSSPLSEFKLGSSTGLSATYPQPAESFSLYSEAQEQFKPGRFKYTAVLFAGEPYGLLSGWCAKDQATLEENWKKMTFTATINGEVVNLDAVPQNDRQQNGQACRIWDLNMTPPEGQHQIVINLHFSADTNDGSNIYPTGDYISEYTVLSLQLNP